MVYRSTPPWWYRAVLLCFAAIAALGLGGLLIGDFLGDHRISPSLWLMVLPLLVIVVVPLIRLQRARFVVTTTGIRSTGLLRSHDVTWPEIAVIEVDQAWPYQGRPVVVLHHGGSFSNRLLAHRYALLRGEGQAGVDASNAGGPSIPAAAAIDAHQRYLRGEFGYPGYQGYSGY